MSEEAPPRLTEEEIRSFQRITGGDDLLKAIRAQGVKLPATTESIVYQLERLNNLIEKRVAKPLGNRYNSGTQTIATATTESGMKIPPPEDNYTFEKIYETVFRPADITVHNEGLGNIYVLYRTSINPSSWISTEQKIRSNESFVFPNVYELALRTDLGTTKYQALEYVYAPNTVNVITAERIRTAQTVSTTHFTEAISQNCWETENLTEDTDGNPIPNKITIREVNIQSEANLYYVLWFYSTDGFFNSDIDIDSFVEFVELDIPTLGRRIDTNCDATLNSQWYLQISGLALLLEDEDSSNELHMGLQCISAAGKGVGDAVQIDIRFSDRI